MLDTQTFRNANKWYKYCLHVSVIAIITTLIFNYDYVLYGIGQYSSFYVSYYTAKISTSIINSDGTMTTTLYGVYINSGLIYAGFVSCLLLVEKLIIKKKMK